MLRIAAEYRTRKIPIDGIIQDWDTWEGRENWNQLFFDPKKFPEPAEMIEILHRHACLRSLGHRHGKPGADALRQIGHPCLPDRSECF